MAPAIAVIPSVTKISLAENQLGEEGTEAICQALQTNSTLKELDLSGDGSSGFNIGGLAGAKHVADMLCANASVTSVNVLSNGLNVESADLLLTVKAEKPNLRTLCGLTHEETELNLMGKGLGVGDAKLLAPEILVMGSVTLVSLLANQLDDAIVEILLKLKEEKPTLTTLCGLKPNQTEANFSY